MVILEAEGEADHGVDGQAVRVVCPPDHRHRGTRGEGAWPGAGHQGHGALVDVPGGARENVHVYLINVFATYFHDNKHY